MIPQTLCTSHVRLDHDSKSNEDVSVHITIPANIAVNADITFTLLQSPHSTPTVESAESSQVTTPVTPSKNTLKGKHPEVVEIKEDAEEEGEDTEVSFLLKHLFSKYFNMLVASLPPTDASILMAHLTNPSPLDNLIYPHEAGKQHVYDPIPEFTVELLRFYVMPKGLKLGVFYMTWYHIGTAKTHNLILNTFELVFSTVIIILYVQELWLE